MKDILWVPPVVGKFSPLSETSEEKMMLEPEQRLMEFIIDVVDRF